MGGLVAGWLGGWVAGLIRNIAISAKVGTGAELGNKSFSYFNS